MKVAGLCAALILVAACKKSESTTEAKPADPKPAAPPEWAKDRPASVSAEAITVADALVSTYEANKAALQSGDCAKSASAFAALTPVTKRMFEEAGKVDELAAKDPEAKKWLDSTYNARISVVLTGIKESMQGLGACRSDPAWKETILGWVRATGFEPPAQ